MILLVNGFNLLTNFNETVRIRKKSEESEAQEPLKQIVEQNCVGCVCVWAFLCSSSTKKKSVLILRIVHTLLFHCCDG